MFTVYNGNDPGSTLVSNLFIDNYMKDANDAQLKVYLYLLRSAQDPSILLSVSDMADFFDATPNKVTLALRYWAEKGLLSLEFVNEELSDITLLPMPSEQKAASAGTPVSLETAPAPASKQAAPAPRQAARQANTVFCSGITGKPFFKITELLTHYIPAGTQHP